MCPRHLFCLGAIAMISFSAGSLSAQAGSTPEQNLQTCLSGQYPILCDHSKLTPEEVRQVHIAEHRANLEVCLDGRYVAICRHGDLSSGEARQVRAAEQRANLQVCLDGRYATLCRHEDLSPSEAQQVRAAERSANLRVCLEGSYAALCRHDLLTPAESERVRAAEGAAPRSTPPISARRSAGSTGTDCEAGHWIKTVSGDGEIVVLEDGSVWQVASYDRVTSELWLETTEIVACPDKLVNTDDGESVDAARLK